MITVQAIYTAPVKSLALQTPASVFVGPRGIADDRRFYLVDEVGKLLTQRELGKLVQIGAEYTAEPEWLRLNFPDGNTQQGPVILGRGIGTKIWGRPVRGHVVEGDWQRALSEFCGQPVHLIAADSAGQAFDEFPVSVVSQASLERLNRERLNQERLNQEQLNHDRLSQQEPSRQTSGPVSFEGTRFRPNFLLDGCNPHQEDEWLGGLIQIGSELQLQPIMPDPRCAIVTQDPQTGERDADTLRLIMNYRPSPRNAYFGIYAIVARPGPVSVGDEVQVIKTTDSNPR